MTYGSKLGRRILIAGSIALASGVAVALLLTIESQSQSYQFAVNTDFTPDPFPLGVDPNNATITEQALVEEFYTNNLAKRDTQNNSLWSKITATLQTNAVFQQLASPVSRIIVVWPGERTEEVTQNIGDVLRWNAEDRALFAAIMSANELSFTQGFVPPGQYISHRQATPNDIAAQLQITFNESVTERYPEDIEQVLPLADALVIASLIEREASDFANMREISGVIWNRLFINMPLQLDASLQYVKAQGTNEENWWPAVRPEDKFIDSLFNTYQNKGLPPEPIANPSVEAIVAALNPVVTDCLYYFHSRSREYYCSETYDDHRAKLQTVYGTN